MEKKRMIGILLLNGIFVVIFIISVLLVHYYNNNVSVKMGRDHFRYTFQEHFKGNRWVLYVNGNHVHNVDPFMRSHKEMREHLANADLMQTVYDEGNIRVYAIPLIEYESKYEIFYTVNGVDFYCWSEEHFNVKTDSGTGNRLTELYKYISEEELEKWSEESWE